MGRNINFFKTYRIEDDEIKYIGGGEWGYSYNSIANLQVIIDELDIQIPEYDLFDAPRELNLLDPIELIKVFNKCLDLLSKERNPIIDDESLFCEKELDDLDKYRNNLICVLTDLIELSKEGYFLTIDSK